MILYYFITISILITFTFTQYPLVLELPFFPVLLLFFLSLSLSSIFLAFSPPPHSLSFFPFFLSPLSLSPPPPSLSLIQTPFPQASHLEMLINVSSSQFLPSCSRRRLVTIFYWDDNFLLVFITLHISASFVIPTSLINYSLSSWQVFKKLVLWLQGSCKISLQCPLINLAFLLMFRASDPHACAEDVFILALLTSFSLLLSLCTCLLYHSFSSLPVLSISLSPIPLGLIYSRFVCMSISHLP